MRSKNKNESKRDMTYFFQSDEILKHVYLGPLIFVDQRSRLCRVLNMYLVENEVLDKRCRMNLDLQESRIM